MVVIVSGTMGGGKSFLCVEKALAAWRRGSIVHDNFKWKPAADKYRGLHVFMPEDITKWCTRNEQNKLQSDLIIRGSESCPNLVLIDEAYLYLGIADALEQRERRKFLLEFCAMSRQLGLEIYFISQHPDNIDIGVRKIAAHHIHCVNTHKIPGLGLIAKLAMKQFTRIAKSPQKGLELSRESAGFSQEVGDLYYTTGQGDQIGVETHIGEGEVAASKMSFKLKFLLVIVFLVPVISYFWVTRSSKQIGALALGQRKDEQGAALQLTPKAGPVKSERCIIAWTQTPVFSLVLDDGRELSMSSADDSLTMARRSADGYTVTDSEGVETFYPFKK